MRIFCSAAIPIFSSWDAFCDHRWLWVRYTAAQQALYAILDDLEFGLAAEQMPTERLSDLFRRFRSVLDETNSARKDKRDKIEAGGEEKKCSHPGPYAPSPRKMVGFAAAPPTHRTEHRHGDITRPCERQRRIHAATSGQLDGFGAHARRRDGVE
jgi:hypothetical protein